MIKMECSSPLLAVYQTSHCSPCMVDTWPSKPLCKYTEGKNETQRGWVLARSHTANKWRTRDLNLDILPPRPEFLTTVLYRSLEG